MTATEVQGATLVKRAFQNHRKYNSSFTCRFCRSRVFLFLTKLFWTYSGPNHVVDIPIEDVTLTSMLTHFRNVKKNALLPTSESLYFETWQETRLHWSLVQKQSRGIINFFLEIQQIFMGLQSRLMLYDSQCSPNRSTEHRFLWEDTEQRKIMNWAWEVLDDVESSLPYQTVITV